MKKNGSRNLQVAPLKEKIQTKLLRWFEKKGRDLPWRETRDPYAIWVSETMLQQTQVATVIPYYQKFLESFPTVHHLAQADLSDVLRIWEGLGYYSRARNLHRASQIVSNHFRGKLPDTLKDLLGLPGIGRYTAGAILSIAFNREEPVLDGNVKRVLSRLYSIDGNPGEAGAENRLWDISASLIPKGRASAFNQALMDLGATICTPKDPQCSCCPLFGLCKARATGSPERFPFKAIKKKIPHVQAVAAVIGKNGRVLLSQRPPRGLLGGLWEFPNWAIDGETRSNLKPRLRTRIKKEMGMDVEAKESLGIFQQTFSHFKLTLNVFNCEVVQGRGKGKWVPIQKLHFLPMSRIHRKIADKIA